jgi:hypothetical protein
MGHPILVVMPAFEGPGWLAVFLDWSPGQRDGDGLPALAGWEGQ